MLSFQQYKEINQAWLAEQPIEVQQKYERKYRGKSARRVARVRPAADCTQETQDAFASTKTDFGAVERASRALKRLSRDRCDHYETWVAVGMALCELGRMGFVMWD